MVDASDRFPTQPLQADPHLNKHTSDGMQHLTLGYVSQQQKDKGVTKKGVAAVNEGIEATKTFSHPAPLRSWCFHT